MVPSDPSRKLKSARIGSPGHDREHVRGTASSDIKHEVWTMFRIQMLLYAHHMLQPLYIDPLIPNLLLNSVTKS